MFVSYYTNASRHLGWLLNKNKDFERLFYFFLYRCLFEYELRLKWGAMIYAFELNGNELLEATLDLRSKWYPAIRVHYFFAGLFSFEHHILVENASFIPLNASFLHYLCP